MDNFPSGYANFSTFFSAAHVFIHSLSYVSLNVTLRHSNPCTGLETPLRIQENKALREMTHEGGKVVSPRHRLPLPQRDTTLTHLYYRVDPRAIMWPEGLSQ
jgi:hypothetical protein